MLVEPGALRNQLARNVEERGRQQLPGGIDDVDLATLVHDEEPVAPVRGMGDRYRRWEDVLDNRNELESRGAAQELNNDTTDINRIAVARTLWTARRKGEFILARMAGLMGRISNRTDGAPPVEITKAN